MASLSRFDSTIARFDPPPMTRSWPGPEGLRALFEASVHEMLQHCRRHPLAWLSDADLASLLYAILAHQLPAHGLSRCCLHAGLALPTSPTPDARYRARHMVVDIALLHPDTVRVHKAGGWEGSVELFAIARRGYGEVGKLKGVLEGLAAVARGHPEAASYLIVVGYGEDSRARDEVARLALQRGVPLLGEIIDASDHHEGQPPLL
ncbi:MAG: hypothetical protein ACOX2R_09050 [Anaerolineae bacterium]|jgi:hypothetical protein